MSTPSTKAKIETKSDTFVCSDPKYKPPTKEEMEDCKYRFQFAISPITSVDFGIETWFKKVWFSLTSGVKCNRCGYTECEGLGSISCIEAYPSYVKHGTPADLKLEGGFPMYNRMISGAIDTVRFHEELRREDMDETISELWDALKDTGKRSTKGQALALAFVELVTAEENVGREIIPGWIFLEWKEGPLARELYYPNDNRAHMVKLFASSARDNLVLVSAQVEAKVSTGLEPKPKNDE